MLSRRRERSVGVGSHEISVGVGNFNYNPIFASQMLDQCIAISVSKGRVRGILSLEEDSFMRGLDGGITLQLDIFSIAKASIVDIALLDYCSYSNMKSRSYSLYYSSHTELLLRYFRHNHITGRW